MRLHSFKPNKRNHTMWKTIDDCQNIIMWFADSGGIATIAV